LIKWQDATNANLAKFGTFSLYLVTHFIALFQLVSLKHIQEATQYTPLIACQ